MTEVGWSVGRGGDGRLRKARVVGQGDGGRVSIGPVVEPAVRINVLKVAQDSQIL